MPKLSTSENIIGINFIADDFNAAEFTPASGFAMVGVDASGIYWADSSAVVHRTNEGGGGGGAEELTDLTDVSAADQTANFIFAAGDGSTGGDYRGRLLVDADIPQLSMTKIEFRGVKATASGIVIDTEFTDVDVDTLVEDYDTDDFLGGDGETFTIPNDFGGYYEIIIDIQTTIASGSIPLVFIADLYIDNVFTDRWRMDNGSLQSLRTTWTTKMLLTPTDALTFKVSKEGGTALATDEVSVIVTIQFIGVSP